MTIPGEFPPQRVLTPRRKRAFLSFRRKSDLIWFLTSVIMFSGGTAAFVLAVFFIEKEKDVAPRGEVPSVSSLPAPAPAEPSAPVPLDEPPSPAAVSPSPKKTVEKPLPRSGVARSRPAGPPSSASVPIPKTEPKPLGYFLLQQAGPFKTLSDRKAKVVVEAIPSVGEPAIQLSYDLSQGDWVQCFVNVREDFSKYSRIQFLFNGEGPSNTLEMKLVDSDGTNVGMFWPQQTGKKVWTVVDLPLSDLPYLWGGDSTLALKRIRQIFFAVSKKAGDKGGRGRVTIRGIKFS